MASQADPTTSGTRSEGRTALGRFGWKANAPNLIQQTAGAYNGDMGVTTDLFPAEPCEASTRVVRDTRPSSMSNGRRRRALYSDARRPRPARPGRQDGPSRREGLLRGGLRRLPRADTQNRALPDVPEVSNQEIHPYTDLLVHDMGPGLADGRPDFQASGSEWRTAPLWGIGLVETVNGHTNFLHDGRARTLLEAVMWHGGEAKRARDRVQRLRARDRSALIVFLQSL